MNREDRKSGDRYAAVFNLGDVPRTVHLDRNGIRISSKPSEIRELWSKEVLTRPQALNCGQHKFILVDELPCGNFS